MSLKLKTLLIGLMASAISFQTFAFAEPQYYPTGGIDQVQEYIEGKISKKTFYHKTGEFERVQEYIDGKISKVTVYYKTGEVKSIDEY